MMATTFILKTLFPPMVPLWTGSALKNFGVSIFTGKGYQNPVQTTSFYVEECGVGKNVIK
jgi:hypothetical protein